MLKRVGWPALRLLPLLLGLLISGCLLTLGGPLTRRVEPGRWRLEAAVGPSLVNEVDSLNALAYGYAGRALGRHWELGAMPYVYSWEGETVLALALPLRWDPFPNSWPLHLVAFAGPLGFWVPGNTIAAGALSGVGLSLRMGELAEFYVAGSSFLPPSKYLSSSIGARFDLANGFELGVGAVMAKGAGDTSEGGPDIVMASVTVSTLLGPK